MRVFQNIGLYPAYHRRLNILAQHKKSFGEYKKTLLEDRYGACHLLLPVDLGESTAFLACGDHSPLQLYWAEEHGMARSSQLSDILLAQIEHHRAEVFYNLDPIRYGSDFLRRLPGCVRYSVAWRAAPSFGADFSAYNLVVCNFPSILKEYQDRGLRSAYFSPSYDPVMGCYAANTDRPIDVLFVGGYSRHHRRRAEVLEAVAAQAHEWNIVFHLDRSKLTRLAEGQLGRLLPLKKHRRPAEICAVTAEPVFGLDLYAAISRAKIVLNGAVDMAGDDRGNMRCFETLGCGAFMVSDAGRYPEGMIDGLTMRTYENSGQVVDLLRGLLMQPSELRRVAQRGHELLSVAYDKNQQWRSFQELIGSL